ncbi:MAG: PDZ domain-containing protein [Candidatus Binatia bacterium]
MLTVNAHRRSSQALIGMLLCGLPAVASAEGLYHSASQSHEEMEQGTGRQQIGAPQVLEIPPVQETAPSIDSSSAVDGRPIDIGTPQSDSLRPGGDPPSAARRSYLGLLYVSADDEEDGVVVVDTIVGSPAARAGFIGEKTEIPSTRTEQMMKVAMAALVMSPAAPAIVPLAIAHEVFFTCRPRGDIIVAIGDRLVRNAQDFNDEMRRYRPGEQVTFSVKRCGKPAQITAQLEEEPAESLPYDGIEVEDQSPPSYREPSNVGITTSGSSFLP